MMHSCIVFFLNNSLQVINSLYALTLRSLYGRESHEFDFAKAYTIYFK